MPRIQFVAKLAVDRDTGLPLPQLAGQAVQIVKRGTSTPVTIWENEAGTLVIPSSQRTVTSHLFVPSFWVMDTDLPVSALGGGIEVPLESVEGVAKRLDSLEPALVAASTAAVDTAASVATFQKWVELGITRRNLITNPSFELGTAGVSFGSSIETVTSSTFANSVAVGARGLIITGKTPATGSGVSTFVCQTVPALENQWISFGAAVRFSSTPIYGRIAILARDAVGTTLATLRGPFDLLTTAPNTTVANRRSFAAQMPAGTVEAWVGLEFALGISTPGLPDGAGIHTDAWIAAAADTESAALAGVAAYFDGDTPSTQYRANRWSGTPHASVSEQLDMTPITDQQLPAGGTMGQALVKLSSNDRDVAWGTVAGGSGGVSVHGLLSGLGQDDHTQYLNNSRGDARYYTKSQVDTIANNAANQTSSADRARGNHTGTQAIATVTGLETRLANLEAGGGGGGSSAVTSVAGRTGDVVIAPTDVVGTTVVGRNVMVASSEAAARNAFGLGNVNNTADADKPLSTAATAANAERIPTLSASPVKPTGSWYGSQAQYDALGTKVSTVIYTILEGV